MVSFVKEFEQYILSDGNQETLLSLINGSQADIYIQIINNIKKIETPDSKLNSDIWNLLKKFKEKVDNQTYNKLRLVVLLREYDLDETKEERRKEILEEIKSAYFSQISYNHPKPTYAQKKVLTDTSDSKRLNDKLDESIFSINTIAEKYYKAKESDSIGTLPLLDQSTFAQHIDLTKLNDILLIQIIKDFYDLPFHELNDEVLKRFANIIDKDCNLAKGITINLSNLLIKCTYAQLEKLSDYITSEYFDKNIILNAIINKKYFSKLNSTKEDNEKRDVLIHIYNLVKEKGPTFKALKSNILLKILKNGIKIKQYDLEIFKEYVTNPVEANTGIFKMEEKKRKEISNWQRYNICEEEAERDSDIIPRYLKHFFLFDNLTIKDFSECLKYEYLIKHYYEAIVLRGEESEEIINYLTQSTYEQLVKKTEIAICVHNKPKFNIDESVVLEVDIKNVQTLFVKIFEINCENYYYNKKQPINTAMSLEGLIATYEETYSFNEKPQKLIRRQIELDNIPKRRGLFIIEMIGNGYSSRAIIQKGGLSLVTRATTKGLILFILDEKSEICKSETSGVWFMNNFYSTSIESGAILIPYMRETQSDNSIIVHDNFAELAYITVTEEKYDLQGFFHFNHESLIMGNTCKILVKPYLTINGREARLEKLRNCKITVMLTKIENDNAIPISHVFDKFKVNEEIEIEIQIPPKLNKIDFIFEADVRNMSKEKNDSLSFRDSFQLNSYNEDFDLVKFYLNKRKGEYILYVLGKNGEPKVDEIVSISFNHNYIKNKIIENLQTNENGQINLGKLENIQSIKASINYLSRQIKFNWELPNNQTYSYPKTIDILNTDIIELPFNENSINNSNITFVKMTANCSDVIEDTIDKIKLLSKNENNTRHSIHIDKLEEGTYILSFKKYNHTVTIKVHNGRIWNNNNFIITKDNIIENTENKEIIQITDINVSNDKIEIKINSKNNPRLNLFMYQYLHSLTSTVTNTNNNLLNQRTKSSVHSFKRWNNFYLPNKQLNEEIQYVFDRKYYERFIGNTLEKPSLLMKRQFIKDTTTEMEKVGTGTEYESKYADLMAMDHFDTKQYNRCESAKYRMACGKYESPESLIYSNFHNFLANSPKTLLNLKPDKDGVITIDKLNISDYSHIHLIAFDDVSISEEYFDINTDIEIQKKNLTLSESLNVDKSYSELRVIHLLKTDETITIEDITSTSFNIIDSVDKFINFATLVNPSLNNEWSKYTFLLKLSELTEEEIKKNISSYWCHEVNLFIYFRYPDIFEKYVKPVIRFKAEKTFVDFFLMNDRENILTYSRSDRIDTLNVFEKCLLVHSIKSYDKNIAENIVNNILCKSDETKTQPQEIKRLFNILMNMKVEDQINSTSQPLMDICNMMGYSNVRSVAPMMMTNYCMKAPQNESVKLQKKCKKKMKKECNFEQAEEELDDSEVEEKVARANIKHEAGKSKEYCETHYKNLAFDLAYLVGDRLFWADLASHLLNDETHHNFLSKNIMFSISSITELILLLAVLDLPITPSSHEFNRKDGRSLEIVAKSNLMLFTKEIAEAQENITTNLLIAQNVSLQTFNQQKVTEYLINRVYQHETIVTNISSDSITFELLIQIPEGAIPVMGSEYTKTVNNTLIRFNTISFITFFYFPNEGEYKQYPPNVAIDGQVISRGDMKIYKVSKFSTNQTKESLENVLEIGSKADILEFISSQKYIKEVDLAKVFWLLKEKDFYLSTMEILRKRGIYNDIVWGYSFYHKDVTTVKEYICKNSIIRDAVGPKFKSKLLEVDNHNNFDILYHLDYHPIINARVHRLGQENNLTILNKELKETYGKFLVYLISLNKIDSKCWLRLSYYLILQDRLEEAQKAFKKININEFNEFNSYVIQYDYIAAYIDFSTGYPDFKVAKENCKKYKDFPLTQ
jgi:hypothetical protein